MTEKTSGTTVSRASVWKKRLGFLLGAIVVVAICVAIRHIGGGPEKADATPPEQPRTQNYPVRQATATVTPPSAAAAPTTTPRSTTPPAGAAANSAQKPGNAAKTPKK